MESEGRQGKACLAELERLNSAEKPSRDKLFSCMKAIEELIADTNAGQTIWMAIERTATEVFEQVDQETEFQNRCKWFQVEILLISLTIVEKSRLKLSLLNKERSQVDALLATMAYRCRSASRFAVEGSMSDKQQSTVRYQTIDVCNDLRDVWRCCSGVNDTSGRDRAAEIGAVIGVVGEGAAEMRPGEEFLGFVPWWKDYWMLTVLLDSLVVAQLSVEARPIRMLGELVYSYKLYMKYQQQKENNDKKFTLESVKWLVKAADKLITEHSDSSDINEEFIIFKSALNYLSPAEMRLSDRLECLYKIKVGDYKELLKYKQSLNLSNPADILFDLVIDLFRNSLPSATFSNSVKVLLHKLSTPGVSQLLTADFLYACKPYFSGTSGFSYLLLVQASLAFDSQLLGLFLQSISSWLESLREDIRKKKNVDDVVSQYFSEISLAKIEGMLEKDSRQGHQENKWLFVKCAFISFYLAKLTKDYTRATSCLQMLFKHSENLDNLWSVNEESGSFFLDVLQVVCEKRTTGSTGEHHGSTMDIEQSFEEKENKTILKFLMLIAEPGLQDSPKMKAYKSAIKLKLELNGLCTSKQSEKSISAVHLFNTLPFEELCCLFKTELSNPGVYYAFFFNALVSYLEEKDEGGACIRSTLQFMMMLYEEMLQVLPPADQSAIQAVLPILIGKLYDRSRQALGSDLADRLAAHLYNGWCISQESIAIEQAVRLAGVGGKFESITAAFVFNAIKSSAFQTIDRGLLSEIACWCDRRLSDTSKAQGNKPIQSGEKQMKSDSQVENDLLEELERLEAEQNRSIEMKETSESALSRPQLLYTKIVCSYFVNPDKFSGEFSHIISNLGNQLTSEEYGAIFHATQTFADKSIQNQFLRHYLSRMLSTGESDAAGLLEIYEALLESTDSIRELKTYLIQMVGVIEMVDPQDKSITPQSVKSLVLQLAKVKEDFQSLSEQISKIAVLIAEKWSSHCSQVKGVNRVLTFIKETSD